MGLFYNKIFCCNIFFFYKVNIYGLKEEEKLIFLLFCWWNFLKIFLEKMLKEDMKNEINV